MNKATYSFRHRLSRLRPNKHLCRQWRRTCVKLEHTYVDVIRAISRNIGKWILSQIKAAVGPAGQDNIGRRTATLKEGDRVFRFGSSRDCILGDLMCRVRFSDMPRVTWQCEDQFILAWWAGHRLQRGSLCKKNPCSVWFLDVGGQVTTLKTSEAGNVCRHGPRDVAGRRLTYLDLLGRSPPSKRVTV